MTVTQLQPPRDSGTHDERWMPSRAGILNVWRYYDEVFSFHDGRLLLRGPNGSGKSKALELLLPFLFDANLRASRLSTFGTSERTMHWNLMGEGASGRTRVGYVWLEFSRPSGDASWFTCGARLQASSHTTTVHADYFTTDLRIGPDGIALVNELGMPLTRGALVELLGDRGIVHDSAAGYRSAIRSTLFPGLNDHRYDALIMALLQLRTPKLSQRLDPALLSTLLSRALPPLDPQEIADLAEGFERLDAQRERLRTLEAEVDAATSLARRQRAYAQRVLRAAAGTLIAATSKLQTASDLAKELAETQARAVGKDAELEAQLERLEGETRRTKARQEGLIDSDIYRGGRDMDDLRKQVESARKSAERTAALATQATVRAEADERALDDAVRLIQRAESIAARHGGELRQAADRVDLATLSEELLAEPMDDVLQARRLLRATVRAREEDITKIRNGIEAQERAIERRQEAEQDLDLARSDFDRLEKLLDTAIDNRSRALTDLASRLVSWARACHELVFTDLAALGDHVESESALHGVVAAAASTVTSDVATRQTTVRAALDVLSVTRIELEEELEQLAQGELPPEASPYRTMNRGSASGAPLWRLVDFSPTVHPDTQPQIEAALQASGLLDAWVTPSGEAWLHSHDTFVDLVGLSPAEGRSLADVLTPEHDGPVTSDVVQRLLAAVAIDDHLPVDARVAIGLDGTWRMGALTGSWEKDSAAHIGAAARQKARERRGAEIRAQLATVVTETTSRKSELDALELRLEQLAAELAELPSYESINQADADLATAQAKVDAAEDVVRQRVLTVTNREERVAAALRALTSLAAEARLPVQRQGLAAVEGALRSFADLAESWLDAQTGLTASRRQADDLRTQAERSSENAVDRAHEAAEAAAAHETLAVRLATLEASIGQDYREILDEITRLRRQLDGLAEAEKAVTGQRTQLARELGELTTRHESAQEAHNLATSVRDDAASRFRALAGGAFPADSNLPNLAGFKEVLAGSDGVRAALDAARQVAAAWPDLPHAPSHLADAVRRLSESVHECRDSLRARADLDLETDEDVQVFTAIVDGLRVGAVELLQILRRDADQSRLEITDQERDLFDRTLTGDTRRHLAQRIRQANTLVEQMNDRLAQVRTASKVAVQLVWQIAPELPAGTKTARELLLKDPAGLSEDDRDSLHRFLRDRVEQARADDTATTWAEQLAQVFDYTAWHHFVVKVDRGKGDGWQPLTRKLHGALSGGEKAIALHLPLFAVVAAHYESVPAAPRVILLDEVFVGVDSTNRGQVFALLAALDLDLMLTSDHEWCTYAELPGIGIHQLLTAADGDDAVTTARFTWDGHDLVADRD